MKKLQLFDQNHGLSPLQKFQFCLLFKSMFILSRKASFLSKTSPYTSSGCVLHKTKRSQIFKFLTKNHGLTPLQKYHFCGFLNPMFLLFRKAGLLYKTAKIIFSRFIFTTYEMGIHGVTRAYKGLKGVTRVTMGYRGWQGVTRGYRGLQGITRGDRWWQGVTGGYKGW